MANEQRAHCSHLLGESNRRLIKEAMARHVVTDGLLVARLDSPNAPRTLPLPNGVASPSEDASGTLLEAGLPDRSRAGSRDRRGNQRPGRAGGEETDERTGAIVGFVMYGPETGSYEQSVDRGIIENVFVHPDYRDREIGTALLDAAERALAESGVDTIALEVMAENDDARRFYARRGYQPHRLELEVPAEGVDSEAEVDGESEVEPGPESDRHTNEGNP
ncbi:GNAT family N-acetyltransferase [Halobacteriales archaeon QS_3_64_16]|nr:MAG: GNAT family N-acetyltransferase [Halobacteriales archaeon QS_3_64_16]